MKKLALVCLSVWALAFSSEGWTKDGNEESTVYTTEYIKSLDQADLEALRDMLNEDLAFLKEVLGRSNNNAIPLYRVSALGQYQTQEAVEALFAVLRNEMKRGLKDNGKGSLEVMALALDTMAKIGTASPSRYLEELTDVIEEHVARLGLVDPTDDGTTRQLVFTYKILENNRTPLLDLNDHINHIIGKSQRGDAYMKRFQDYLEARIVGQPEVIQALVDLEWRAQLYEKSRALPDVIYLMGLPGTGKDTAAEVLTDALHGFKMAHRKHMFRMPKLRANADLWQLLGSATGYVGSDNFPPFLEFLVQHSGGRYKIEKTQGTGSGKETYKVLENKDFKGETLQGYFPPNTGIVFVNEFHNWSKSMKDQFLKEALEKGRFTINNPNGGLSEIFVPIRFVIASNEGIGLVTSRESNGQRHGKPMSYEQILAKWEHVHHNKAALKAEILATNGRANGADRDESKPGISEEMLNRVPDDLVLLMRPLSPEDLQKIAKIGLEDLSRKMSDSDMIGKIHLEWGPDVLKMVQGYDYSPEENARPIFGRLASLVEQPLIDALREGRLPQAERLKIKLSIASNDDRTLSLVIEAEGGGQKKNLRQLIRATLKDIPAEPISDSRIEELAGLAGQLKQHVFGIDEVVERIAQRILNIENESQGSSSRPVNVIMLNGLSSTGKTETAKQLARLVRKSDDELITFDFSQIQTLHDFKVKILGLKDGAGNAIPSEFMKHYDRNGGKLIVAFDELANVRDMDLLKALYDFFREPVMHTFSDGKARPMGGVTVVVTGNPGQELYSGVPRDVPMAVQMYAWEEIARQTQNDPELQRQVLEKYYPEPLITRIGRNNIFFMPPHNYRSLRQLAQLKLGQALKRLSSTDSRRGWKVLFPTQQEYSDFIDTVVEEGFSLRYQGASIESFVRDDVEEPLKNLLLQNKVPSGAKVLVKFKEKTSNHDEHNPGYVNYEVSVEGQSEILSLKIRRPYVEKSLERNLSEQLVTAYHEAGHELVRRILFEGAFDGVKISVIPGVSRIGDRWIYYAGVAQYEKSKEISYTREYFVRQIAVLAAGYVAEQLVVKGGRDSAGKSNDLERATRMAQDAVIKYGLGRTWGNYAVPSGWQVQEYIGTLSESAKQKLEAEVQSLLEEGEALARASLEANFKNGLIPMGAKLAELGEMDAKKLQEFYQTAELVKPSAAAPKKRKGWSLASLWPWSSAAKPAHDLSIEFENGVLVPSKMADINEIAKERKAKQYASVEIPADAPIAQVEPRTVNSPCEAALQ
ncbi:MAG: hypothetical protein AB7F86_00315 [Bdellovibrionales bacterium]